MKKQRKHEVEVQERFHGFVKLVCDRILEYAKSEARELCFDLENAARS